MLDGIQTCAACRTQVLPNRDGRCPACRKYDFRSATAESAAVTPPPPPEPTQSGDLLEGAKRYWLFLAMVGAQIGAMSAMIAPVVRGTSESVATIVSGVIAVGLVVAAYRLAAWLQPEGAIWWALGLFLPCIGLVVVLGLARRATAEFRARQAPMGPLGPSVRAIRAAQERLKEQLKVF
jgi:hypothetical protein